MVVRKPEEAATSPVTWWRLGAEHGPRNRNWTLGQHSSLSHMLNAKPTVTHFSGISGVDHDVGSLHNLSRNGTDEYGMRISVGQRRMQKRTPHKIAKACN